MKVEFTGQFIKTYKRRFSHKPVIRRKFSDRAKLFEQNPSNEVLKNHALVGKMEGFRAFSITADIRVIYYVYNDIAYFTDIGTHNQVYK